MLEDSAILRARNQRRRAAAASPAAPAAEVARHGTRAMMAGETIGRVKTLRPDLGGWATGGPDCVDEIPGLRKKAQTESGIAAAARRCETHAACEH